MTILNEAEIVKSFNDNWNNLWQKNIENSPFSKLDVVKVTKDLTDKIKLLSKEIRTAPQFTKKSYTEHLRYCHLARALINGKYFTSVEDLNGINSLNIDSFKNFLLDLLKKNELKPQSYHVYKMHDHVDQFLIIPIIGIQVCKILRDNEAWCGLKTTIKRFLDNDPSNFIHKDIYYNNVYIRLNRSYLKYKDNSKTEIKINLELKDNVLSFNFSGLNKMIEDCKIVTERCMLESKSKFIKYGSDSACLPYGDKAREYLNSFFDFVWGNNSK